jgi:hypothetical protein
MHTAQQATGFRTSPTGLARYADLDVRASQVATRLPEYVHSCGD